MRRILAGVVFASILMLVSSCASACGCSSFAPESPVDGVVIAVDAASLTDIRSFAIATQGGGRIDFKLGTLENATQFSPSHLKEHQATSEPIRVWFRIENGDRVAYRLEDAPG